MIHIRFALEQNLANQSLKSMRQGCIRNIALELIKFAGCKKPAWRNKNLV